MLDGGVTFYQTVLTALDEAGLRFVVVGGVAMVLHGHLRLTVDLDLVVDPAPDEARRAVRVLTALGLKPVVPVDPLLFAEPSKREEWIRDRNMLVFTLRDPGDPRRTVDLFLREPIPFEELFAAAARMGLGRSTVRVASRAHLIRMKRLAGRPKDLLDIEALEGLPG
jgi:hypothetical protein